MADPGPIQANPAARSGFTPSNEVVGVLLATGGAVALGFAPSTAFALLALLGIVAGLAQRPSFGLLLLGFTLPFYLGQRTIGPMSFSIPELLLLCTLLAGSIRVLARHGSARRTIAELATPLDGAIALFLAAALLSLVASEVLRVSVRELRTTILEPVAAFYLAIWLLRDRPAPALMMGALLAGGCAAAGMGIFQYLFTDHVVAVEGSRRILGPYLSPNNLGLYLGRTIPVAAAAAIYFPRFRWASMLLLALLAGAVLLTFSLGAWLAAGAALLAVILLWRPSSAPFLAAGCVVLLVVATPLLSVERIASHFSLQDGTSFLRLQLWQSSLRMIADHPILGVGMDNFLYLYRSDYLLPGGAIDPNLSHPHNLVLNFWLELGVLGLAALCWLVFILVRRWRALWSSPLSLLDRAVLAGVAGAAVDALLHGMIDNSYFLVDLSFYFWLAAAVVLAIERRHVETLLPRRR